MRLQFSGTVFEWRGPAPHHFVALSPEVADAVASVSARASYGWGCIPVSVTVGDTRWRTTHSAQRDNVSVYWSDIGVGHCRCGG